MWEEPGYTTTEQEQTNMESPSCPACTRTSGNLESDSNLACIIVGFFLLFRFTSGFFGKVQCTFQSQTVFDFDRTNLPKNVMEFPDFPVPAYYRSFMDHSNFLAYLQNYAKAYNLHKYIKVFICLILFVFDASFECDVFLIVKLYLNF